MQCADGHRSLLHCLCHWSAGHRRAEGALAVELTGGVVELRTVRAAVLQVAVFRNGRYVYENAGDEFVRWPYYLDVEAADEQLAPTKQPTAIHEPARRA